MIAVYGESGQVKIWQAANEIRSETHKGASNYDVRTDGGREGVGPKADDSTDMLRDCYSIKGESQKVF